ncbi:MAG TPA: rRNA adenine N-6-methyltransferase family protein, partial [Nitrososphaeraceae archaeon]|nr:rRNA adenine N-6-methyltransferase family protein [Nitrososphaeraceae archaeon]
MNLNKQLGQNYLISKKIVTKIIENSEIRPDETVCEMGSGKGAMTFDLCKKAKSVISFEIDKKLYEQLFMKSIKYK